MKAQRSTNVQPHQRQYQSQSDQLLFDPSVANKWLQGEYGRGTRGLQRGASGEIFVTVEPASPLPRNWSRDELVSSSQYSPGLLDLHSCDTELLPESGGHGFYDGSYASSYNQGSVNDLDPSFNLNKKMPKPDALPENGYLKSFPVDKEKLASVAKIKVVVRKRPLNKKEIAKKEEDIISIEGTSNCLTVHETKLKVDLTEYVERHEFVFDAVLDEDVSNDEVYRETVEPVVPAIFQRTKATCFAYGQTGIGKTFTMKPLPLKASQDILRLMNHAYRNQGFQLFVSFFEIYGGKLFDLLNDRKKLLMREDGKQKVCIVGLQEYRVNDVEMIRELIEKGNATRSTGTTGANEESSRSHAILQLAIKRLVDANESKPPRPIGKLSFIDLAGSERGADTTDNDKQTRIEGAEINKSLLALKECIRALDNDQTHIPFRGSKLTEVLRDSFIGDSRTVMISCISPSSGSCEHTLNTLRYADRVKSLSKGGNPKKDTSMGTLRESTNAPLPSFQPPEPTPEGINNTSDSLNNIDWPKPPRKETNTTINYQNGMQKRESNRSKNSTNTGADEFYEATTYQQSKRGVSANLNWESVPDEDDQLNELLKEEEDLVIAHKKQVEESLDIIKEEMNLLVEADQPGNQLDDYVSRLNDILSYKAARILDLQSRLAQFQRRLNEQGVLFSSQYS
ncbi:Kinesin-like protein [Rhynchospora pubera]|uniref:Kinesin-like protein n=1 Tax=Rhynchospora pubera TaxID=906938 RepID=A0AAV8HTF0_9POAL|nr:Kinesin-like protein [Rhynchospora pubera]KAJ4821158.1 Kinesin-like protein [Rhynchospora pubera]